MCDINAEGQPDIFQSEFKGEIKNIIYKFYENETRKIIVAADKKNCGNAIIHDFFSLKILINTNENLSKLKSLVLRNLSGSKVF